MQYKGRAIRLLDDDIAYMIMKFCSGKEESPSTITIEQMYSLGNACAVERFRDEILWLTENWFELELMVFA